MKILILANSIESVGGGGPGGPVCNPEPPNKQSDGGSSQLVSSKEKHKGMTEIMATLILQLFFFAPSSRFSPHVDCSTWLLTSLGSSLRDLCATVPPSKVNL